MAQTKKSRKRGAAETRNVLLTGFEPFGGEAINPSGEIARQLHGAVIGGHRVCGALLPCVFGAAIAELKRQMRVTKPALVICVGQAGGRAEITPERVAINVDDARIPDNAGRQPVDRPVVRGGPAAYWSALPIKAMVAEMRRQGIPAAVSQTAGTFVCNHVFYGLMHALATQPALAGVRGGFIHVPWLPQQGTPAMALDDLVRGTAQALQCALTTPVDLARSAGALH